MRLVLVHGRGQGEKEAGQIEQSWRDALGRGLQAAGLPPLAADLDVRLPFYGKVLDEMAVRPAAPGEVVARGPGDVSDPFEGMLVLELAERAGISDEEIAAELGQERVARGPENWEWVHAAGRVISRRVPWLGERLLPVMTRDVHAYLSRLDVTEAVNDLVAADLDAGPAVVVGHSLGSIVAYWVLTERAPGVDVRLFVTVGSPLGVDVVKKYLPRPLGRPSGVAHWLNAADERDPVALYSRLDRDIFPAEIENVNDVHNPSDNPHGIAGYLGDRVVAQRLSAALTQA